MAKNSSSRRSTPRSSVTAPKQWTSRKLIAVHAGAYRRQQGCTAHEAVEAMIADWKQKRINGAAVNYYLNASARALVLLFAEVMKH